MQLIEHMVRGFQLEAAEQWWETGKNLGKGNEKSRIKLLGIPNVCGQDEEKGPAQNQRTGKSNRWREVRTGRNPVNPAMVSVQRMRTEKVNGPRVL